MKARNLLIGILMAAIAMLPASAQFAPGQVLGAAALNAALAAPTILGGSINNAPIGNVTPNTGSFTTLSTLSNFFVPGTITATSTITAPTITATSALNATNATIGGFTMHLNSPNWVLAPYSSTMPWGSFTVGSNFGVIESITAQSNGINTNFTGNTSALAVTGGTGTIANLIGFRRYINHSGSGLATNVQVYTGQVGGTGPMGTADVYAAVPGFTSTPVTSLYGFHVYNLGASNITNAVGFKADDMTASGTLTAGFQSSVASGTTKWNIYADGTANNYMNGELLIGTTTPVSLAGFKGIKLNGTTGGYVRGQENGTDIWQFLSSGGNMTFQTLASRGISFLTNTSNQALQIGDTASAVNAVTINGAVAGGNPSLSTTSGRLAFATPVIVTTGTVPNQLRMAQTTPPTCSSNCGTSPAVVGTDTAMTVTMGATGTPTSAFVITFNGAWASVPSCVAQMALSGMAVGKLPIVASPTTTTLTITTNGTAPANSDKYAVHCLGVS